MFHLFNYFIVLYTPLFSYILFFLFPVLSFLFFSLLFLTRRRFNIVFFFFCAPFQLYLLLPPVRIIFISFSSFIIPSYSSGYLILRVYWSSSLLSNRSLISFPFVLCLISASSLLILTSFAIHTLIPTFPFPIPLTSLLFFFLLTPFLHLPSAPSPSLPLHFKTQHKWQ